MDNSAPALDVQQVFQSTFKRLINEDYSIAIDISQYQGVLEKALSKVDFSVGTGIYMLPSNLNLNIGKKKGYNNKQRYKQRYEQGPFKIACPPTLHTPFPTPMNDPKTVIPTSRHDLKTLTEKHNDEKLAITFLIVGTGLFAYHFW